MKHEGRSVVRLNDKTTHDGEVISASGPTVLGQRAALDGDMTHCPRCGGEFAIQADGAGARHEGRVYAYADAKTACGARLIASLE